MSTSNNNKRPSSPTKPSEPPAKKAANNGSSPSTIDIHLDETFGVKPDVLYDALVDGKKYAEAVGMKGWEGKLTVGYEGDFAEGYCSGKVLCLVPNKLIVQEWRENSWSSDTVSSTVTVHLSPQHHNSNGTRLRLTQVNVPAERAKDLQSGWDTYVLDPIRKLLKDEKSSRPQRVGRNLCHMDIPAQDSHRAAKFYEAVFGWTVKEYFEGYWGFTSGPKSAEWGFVDGGFPTVNEPKTLVDHAKNSSVIPYYDAHPIEEFEKKVTAAGGKVLKPKHPEPFGVISECEDTEGNYFVLYEVPSM